MKTILFCCAIAAAILHHNVDADLAIIEEYHYSPLERCHAHLGKDHTTCKELEAR